MAIELISVGVDSACHAFEVSKMSTSLLGLLSHSSVLRRSGDPSRIVPIAEGNASANRRSVQNMVPMDGYTAKHYTVFQNVVDRL